MNKILYDALGLQPSATDAEIKKAYRVLSRKHHPDTGDGDRAKLAAVQEAYDTLADETKRKAYDEDGTVHNGTDMEAKATAAALQLVVKLASEMPDDSDFIAEAVRATKQKSSQLVAEQIQAMTGAERLEKRSTKIKCKQGENIVAQALRNQAAGLRQQANSYDEAIKLMALVLVVLERFEVTGLPKQPQTAASFFTIRQWQ